MSTHQLPTTHAPRQPPTGPHAPAQAALSASPTPSAPHSWRSTQRTWR
jgi:hypothetical protein